eukprot:2989007-Pleurochrysis_carterae.AAC.2
MAKDLNDLTAAACLASQDDLALPPSPAPTLASGMPAVGTRCYLASAVGGWQLCRQHLCRHSLRAFCSRHAHGRACC